MRLFPRLEGYRFFTIRAPEGRNTEVATALEDGLADYGFDAQSTAARLASYHRVENTYLSTFQALGGLGLLLGTLGLGAILLRNVLERRRELALLQAVGYEGRTLGLMVVAESVVLMAAGIATGTLSALVAVAPALSARATSLPIASTAAGACGRLCRRAHLVARRHPRRRGEPAAGVAESGVMASTTETQSTETHKDLSGYAGTDTLCLP